MFLLRIEFIWLNFFLFIVIMGVFELVLFYGSEGVMMVSC